ncbi:MAG: hypothetical protein KGJ55_03225 [Gammaproteobacteria bacterium]|nr:hypothetical protein [Gammaproteobacteria bacterium]
MTRPASVGDIGIVSKPMPALYAGLVLLGTLAGCAHRIVASAQFPQPLLQPEPLTVGLYIDLAFQAYTHHEKLEDHGDWNFVALGPASTAVFHQVLTAKFQHVLTLTAPRAQSDDGARIVFRPAIEDFQFSTPEQSKTGFYEVWIKYRVHLLAADGRELTNWPIAAYGRHRGALIGGADAALAAAAQLAMRDLAAALALDLRDPGKLPAVLVDGGKNPAESATSDPVPQ